MPSVREKSKGHVCFVTLKYGDEELYLDAQGDLWRAPVSNVLDVLTGYRIGRWEAPRWQAQQEIERLQKLAERRRPVLQEDVVYCYQQDEYKELFHNVHCLGGSWDPDKSEGRVTFTSNRMAFRARDILFRLFY